MDSEKATEYAAMSPQEFVKTRFYTEDLNFLDHLSLKLGEDNSHPDRRPNRPTISADGRLVISVAHYNDVNYHELTRPRQNLQRYCETARRGQWQQVQGYDDDPVAAAKLDLATVYSEAELASLELLRSQNGGAGYAPAEDQIAAHAATLATAEMAARNNLIAAAYAGSGFRNAIDQGAFGVFQCNESTSSWSVSVLPDKLYPSDDLSNLLSTPTAVILIRLLKTEEPREQAANGERPPRLPH
jgi:hypothetical protein